MTTEPPQGLRSNMLTLYNTINEDLQFNRCTQRNSYQKLLFALAWFHAILLERKKFKSLGFNINYDFNESDFAICHDLIIAFLDDYPDKVPLEAMRYLIAEANYGGRVTDDWDRRLVNVYINELFCQECIENDHFKLSELNDYVIPSPGDLTHYKEAIKAFPISDPPAAFGQHDNSGMAAAVEDATRLIDALVSLLPKIAPAIDEGTTDPLAAQCTTLLEQIPPLFDVREVRVTMNGRSDPEPLKTVLYQELDRYNALLSLVSNTLSQLIQISKGTAASSTELEEVGVSLSQLRVPKLWGNTYPSTKPLGPWIRDLHERVTFFNSWINDKLPTVWWLPAMTYPSSFLTAVLQIAARSKGVSIDSLSFETLVLNTSDVSLLNGPAKEGIYVNGLHLDGAGWNMVTATLEESKPMELLCSMPIVHFRPVEGKKKVSKVYYTCPLYMYPVRSGSRERPSYVTSVDLKVPVGTNPERWTKRGVALLLSTSI